MGPNLFYNSPMEACIVICRSRKTLERRGKVLFIDALNDVTRERSKSFLKPEHQERIVAAYRSLVDDPGFAHAASLDEIAAQGYSLSIPLYVRGWSVREAQGAYSADGLKVALAAWEESSQLLRQSLDDLLEKLS